MDRKVLWAISILLFLVAVKAWVLVDRWITSEIFHDVQNANRCCAGHATMSTECGSNISANYSATTFPCYRVKPKNPLAIVVWKPWVTGRRWKIRGSPGSFYRKFCTYMSHFILRLSPSESYTLTTVSNNFANYQTIFHFLFFSKNTNPHNLLQSS